VNRVDEMKQININRTMIANYTAPTFKTWKGRKNVTAFDEFSNDYDGFVDGTVFHHEFTTFLVHDYTTGQDQEWSDFHVYIIKQI